MSENKKFYWIKLRQDFFQQETIDWLQDQENGYAYIVLYLKLCLMTANNGGGLIRTIGDMTVPYDPKKIAQKTGIDFDTVTIAISLFKHLGLIVENQDGVLTLPEVPKMVGEESASKEAVKKRKQRQRKKAAEMQKGTICPQLEGTQGVSKCPTEYRDKSIENRDKRIDIREKKEEKEAAAAANTKNGFQEMVKMYQNNIHPVASPVEKDALVSLYQDYGAEWVMAAIREAALHHATSIAYIRAILNRWKETGEAKPWEAKRKKETGVTAIERPMAKDDLDKIDF